MSIRLATVAANGLALDERIRVMVVDDAAVVRSTIGRWVEAEPDLEMVGLLRGAAEAIEQVKRQNPDVVILDITMPEMDGITALPLLLQEKRDLVVLMVSTLTRRNAEISLRALSLGATDYIAKPQSDREIMGCDFFRRELSPRSGRWGGAANAGVVPPGRTSGRTTSRTYKARALLRARLMPGKSRYGRFLPCRRACS
jgi:two-component system, chemotaxis family, protein-glutamate methylesterase/glutaminase